MRHFITFRLAALACGLLLALAPGARAERLVERGAYLVTALAACGNCHTPRDATNQPLPGMDLAGGREFDEPTLGHVIGPNITPDQETGIGSWSIGQIVNALRNGKRPRGEIIGPPMPIGFYRQLSDHDAEAIATYLKSIPPVLHAVERSKFKNPPPHSYGPIVGHVAEPDHNDKIAYGAYLAGPVAHCLECHTPRTRDGLDLSRLGAGGREFADFGHPGAMTVSRNITADPDEGLGKWSDPDIKRAILVGIRPDGTRLAPTMPFAAYNKMTSDDVNAITAYLRTLKPAKAQ